MDEWEQINDVLEEIGAGEYVEEHFRSLLLGGDEMEQIDNKFKQYYHSINRNS